MSKVLIIRHLPSTLSFQDKEQLLKHFGAEKVWETLSKRYYVFASFATIDKAKASLSRLHQLEIGNRRLVVEYSFQSEPDSLNKAENEHESSVTSKLVKEFLRVLNSWNPSVDFYQPPSPHLLYKYPECSTEIIINVVHALFFHKPFYVQTLHLMNKMCLDIPFIDKPIAVEFFKKTFGKLFINEIQQIPNNASAEESEVESEISSDESDLRLQPVPTLLKRKRKLPNPSRKHTSLLASAAPTLPKVKRVPVNQKEVFDTVLPVQEPKKIALIVHQDALQKPIEEPVVIGELGKFDKEEQPVEKEDKSLEIEQPTITRKELLRNRISYRDMKILPVFKNYHPGQPSMRLYIKNLAKSVTDQDVKSIYKLYIEGLNEEELVGFDVRVMQEGRMKGQGFVTFPSVAIAEKALHETNGYMLKEKPMVVQFARVANKKTME